MRLALLGPPDENKLTQVHLNCSYLSRKVHTHTHTQEIVPMYYTLLYSNPYEHLNAPTTFGVLSIFRVFLTSNHNSIRSALSREFKHVDEYTHDLSCMRASNEK